MLALCLALAASPSPLPQCQDIILEPSPPLSISRGFGAKVALDGNRLLVVSDRTPVGVGARDVILCYELDPVSGEWVEVQAISLLPFGINGITALDQEDGRAIFVAESGTARAIALDEASGQWSVTGTLGTIHAAQPDGSLALEIEDGLAFIQGQEDSTITVYEADTSALGWSLSSVIDAPLGASSDFGYSLDSDGTTLVVGDRVTRGVFYFRRQADGTFLRLGSVRPPGAYDTFGQDVAIEDDVLIVGAPNGSTMGLEAAIFAYRFVPSIQSFILVQTFGPGTLLPGLFGQNFDYEDGMLAVRARGSSTTSALMRRYRLNRPLGLFQEESPVSINADMAGLAPRDTVEMSAGRLAIGDYAANRVLVTLISDLDCDQSGNSDVCELLLGQGQDVNGNWVVDGCEEEGVRFCSGSTVPNSSGEPARIAFFGRPATALLSVDLCASNLPQNSPGYFIVSMGNQVVLNAGGGVGTYCLGGGPLARGYGGTQNSGSDGRVCDSINSAFVPGPNGLIPIIPGDTWNFQYWFRDVGLSGATSNFTDAIGVTFTLF